MMRNLMVSLAVLIGIAWFTPGQTQDASPETAGQDQAPPEVIQFESSVGNVLFPHKTHLKMRCSRCHHQIQADALDTPHQEYLESSWIKCGTCHDADPDFNDKYFKCGDCHHSELDNIADETLSAKVVVHQSCWKCHKTSTGADASKRCGFCHVKENK